MSRKFACMPHVACKNSHTKRIVAVPDDAITRVFVLSYVREIERRLITLT